MRYFFGFMVIIVCSCTKEHDKQVYVGELYFSTFQLGSFYNVEDSIRLKFEQTMDTSRLEKSDSNQRSIIEFYQKFKSIGFLYKPFVDLRINDSTFVKLYLDSSDYDKIKIYKRQYLLDSNKKIKIWARTRELGKFEFSLLYCTELIDVELVDGQTFPEKKGKFIIEDYN